MVDHMWDYTRFEIENEWKEDKEEELNEEEEEEDRPSEAGFVFACPASRELSFGSLSVCAGTIDYTHHRTARLKQRPPILATTALPLLRFPLPQGCWGLRMREVPLSVVGVSLHQCQDQGWLLWPLWVQRLWTKANGWEHSLEEVVHALTNYGV